MRLLHQTTPNSDGGNWAGQMLTTTRHVAERQTEDNPITGYLVVAFFRDGATSSHYRWGDESPMNRALLPHYVAEVVRRDVVTDSEARAVFDEMFERI